MTEAVETYGHEAKRAPVEGSSRRMSTRSVGCVGGGVFDVALEGVALAENDGGAVDVADGPVGCGGLLHTELVTTILSLYFWLSRELL